MIQKNYLRFSPAALAVAAVMTLAVAAHAQGVTTGQNANIDAATRANAMGGNVTADTSANAPSNGTLRGAGEDVKQMGRNAGGAFRHAGSAIKEGTTRTYRRAKARVKRDAAR